MNNSIIDLEKRAMINKIALSIIIKMQGVKIGFKSRKQKLFNKDTEHLFSQLKMDCLNTYEQIEQVNFFVSPDDKIKVCLWLRSKRSYNVSYTVADILPNDKIIPVEIGKRTEILSDPEKLAEVKHELDLNNQMIAELKKLNENLIEDLSLHY